MYKSTHVISADVEYHRHKYGAQYPRMLRAIYEVPALIIASASAGGLSELPLVPGQVEICEGIKELLTPSTNKNNKLVQMGKGARQVQIKVFAEKRIEVVMLDLQLHICFISVGGRNKPFFRIEILIPRTGPSRLLKIWEGP